MRKTELQKTVDRILRALQPFKIEKRQKILNIVSEYISEDLIADDDGDEEEYETSSEEDEEPPTEETDMDISPEERKKRERNERDRERRAAKKEAAEG